jgi:hypothetical protein
LKFEVSVVPLAFASPPVTGGSATVSQPSTPGAEPLSMVAPMYGSGQSGV